jgi:hypothetical protein
MLGNRALMELENYLKNEYAEVVEDFKCTACGDLVTRVSVPFPFHIP